MRNKPIDDGTSTTLNEKKKTCIELECVYSKKQNSIRVFDNRNARIEGSIAKRRQHRMRLALNVYGRLGLLMRLSRDVCQNNNATLILYQYTVTFKIRTRNFKL